MATERQTPDEIKAELATLRERLALCRVEAARDGIRARIDLRLDDLLEALSKTP